MPNLIDTYISNIYDSLNIYHSIKLGIDVRIPDGAVCVSLCANPLWISKNISLLPPAMHKY